MQVLERRGAQASALLAEVGEIGEIGEKHGSVPPVGAAGLRAARAPEP